MKSKLNKIKEGEAWVYVATHEPYNGLVKIGFSTNVPQRMKELQNGSPYPYIAEYRVLVSNAYLLEQESHKFLDNKRTVEGEWFKCSVQEAKQAIETVAKQKNIQIEFVKELIDKSLTKSNNQTKLKQKTIKSTIADIFHDDNDEEKLSQDFLNRKDLALQGNLNAQYELALMYQLGEGVKKDIEKAIEWYEKSAKQGHVKSQVNLGRIFCSISIHRNYDKAKMWFEKAIEQNNADAYYYLANMYQHGYEVKQDLKQAESYYLKAVENGDNEMIQRVIRACLNRKKIVNL